MLVLCSIIFYFSLITSRCILLKLNIFIFFLVLIFSYIFRYNCSGILMPAAAVSCGRNSVFRLSVTERARERVCVCVCMCACVIMY